MPLIKKGENAFKNTKITNINFPSELKYIDSNIFNETNIKEVILSNFAIIDEQAFSDGMIID